MHALTMPSQGLYVVTMFCEDDHDVLPLSCEVDEKLYCELASIDLFPEYNDPKDLQS